MFLCRKIMIHDTGHEIIGICNFCPVKREHYRNGLPKAGSYELVLNSDEKKYGGWRGKE